MIDIHSRMSPSHNNPRPEPSAAAAQLAHELANLLDGSLRHLGIAIDTLSHTQQPPDTVAQQENAGDDKLLDRLQTTDRAMRQMASLIKAWMKSAPKPRDLFDQSQTLGQTLEQVIEIHRPSADRHGIDIELQLEPTAAELPAGPIFPVAANAILNSIEAIAHATPGGESKQHRIVVTVRLEAGLVWLIVSDDGPGIDPRMIDEHGNLRIGQTTKPDGHGLGLMLSQQVAHSLQGTFSLIPNPDGGTRMTLRCPAVSLSQTPNAPLHLPNQTPKD
jgi:signal transduction histidine kinase